MVARYTCTIQSSAAGYDRCLWNIQWLFTRRAKIQFAEGLQNFVALMDGPEWFRQGGLYDDPADASFRESGSQATVMVRHPRDHQATGLYPLIKRRLWLDGAAPYIAQGSSLDRVCAADFPTKDEQFSDRSCRNEGSFL
jgi:hypothetical protein